MADLGTTWRRELWPTPTIHPTISKLEGVAVLLLEMRKNVPFPRRPVAAVPLQMERREIRVL